MNKGMVFSQGGYVKSVPVPVFPDAGEEFFWRVVDVKGAVVLQLRQYKKEVNGSSWVYGVRGPFEANAESINHHANDLLFSLNRQQRNLKNAAKWAGDYQNSRGAK